MISRQEAVEKLIYVKNEVAKEENVAVSEGRTVDAEIWQYVLTDVGDVLEFLNQLEGVITR